MDTLTTIAIVGSVPVGALVGAIWYIYESYDVSFHPDGSPWFFITRKQR